MKFNLLDSSKPQFQKKLLATLKSYLDYSDIDKIVATILNDIRKNGDKSLCFYSQKFDNVKFTSPEKFMVTKAQLKNLKKKFQLICYLPLKQLIKELQTFIKNKYPNHSHLRMI